MHVSTWRHRRTLMLDFGLDEGPLNSQKHMWAHHEENFRSANIQGLKLSAGAYTKGSRIGKRHLHHALKTPGRENVIAQLVGLPIPYQRNSYPKKDENDETCWKMENLTKPKATQNKGCNMAKCLDHVPFEKTRVLRCSMRKRDHWWRLQPTARVRGDCKNSSPGASNKLLQVECHSWTKTCLRRHDLNKKPHHL